MEQRLLGPGVMACWLIRIVGLILAVAFFVQWAGLGAPWIAFAMWLVCAGAAELLVHVSRVAAR